MIYELTKKHLTEDDLKVLKHLRSINNLFRKGDLTISCIFADNGTLKALKRINDEDYEIESFIHVTCDGGDPDGNGCFGVHSDDELEEYYENMEELL